MLAGDGGGGVGVGGGEKGANIFQAKCVVLR